MEGVRRLRALATEAMHVRRLLPALLCLAFVSGCAELRLDGASMSPSAPASSSANPSFHPTASAEPDATSGQIDAAGATGSGAIWAVRGDVLEISADFGKTWRIGSIPLPRPETIGRVHFVLDADHAWSLTVAAGSGDGDGGQGPTFDHVHLIVNRTSDGGRSWQQAPVPGDYPDTSRSLFFLDPAQGFLMISGGRTNEGSSTVLRTDDGGASWAIVRTVPATETATVTAPASLGSQITATDARTIWAGAQGEAGPVDHPILDVSRDGGLSWSRVPLPGLIDRWGGTSNVPLGPPVFLDAQTGFFALTPAEFPSGETLIFGTRDGGRSWSRLSTLPAALGVPIAFADARHWLAAEQGLPEVIDATDDGGKSWHAIPTTGLSAGGLEQLAMLDPAHGFGVLLTQGNSGMPSFLLLTSDGGRTWVPASGVGMVAKASATP